MAAEKTSRSKKLTSGEEIELDALVAKSDRFSGAKSKTSSANKTKAGASSDKSKASSSDKPKAKAASDKAKSKTASSAGKPKTASAPAKSKDTSKTSSKGKAASGQSKTAPSGKTASAKSRSAAPSTAKSNTTGSGTKRGGSVRSYASSIKRTPTRKTSPVKEFFLKIPRWVIHLPLLLLCLLMIWMFCESNVVNLKSADLFLPQLPYAFKGTRVLFISDLHIGSLNSPSKVNAMVDQIMQLEPDLLLLGGDYTAFDPISYVSGPFSGNTPSNAQSNMRNLFFENLAQYNPPLGKFAVAGEHDNRLDMSSAYSLEESAARGGVTLLKNESVRIEHGGQSIVIMGIDDWTTGEKDLYGIAADVTAADCVIMLCHNPEAVPLLNSYPVSDGFWIDFALCGHTHGGIARIGSLELFNPTSDKQRFAAGWHLENTARVLISRGVSNDLLPMRFFAAPEVHLITLK